VFDLVVDEELLLLEVRGENFDFLGRTMPDVDVTVVRLSAEVAQRDHAPVHSQTTNHSLELVIGVVCERRAQHHNQSPPSSTSRGNTGP